MQSVGAAQKVVSVHGNYSPGMGHPCTRDAYTCISSYFMMKGTLRRELQFLLKSSEVRVWGIIFWADLEAKVNVNKSGK